MTWRSRVSMFHQPVCDHSPVCPIIGLLGLVSFGLMKNQSAIELR